MSENLTKVICPSCKFFFDDDGFNAGEPCPISCDATLVSRVYVPQEAVARARAEAIEAALVDLFQACSKLCSYDMDKLVEKINAASRALQLAPAQPDDEPAS